MLYLNVSLLKLAEITYCRNYINIQQLTSAGWCNNKNVVYSNVSEMVQAPSSLYHYRFNIFIQWNL